MAKSMQQVLDRVARQAATRVKGVSPRLAKKLAAFGEPALLATLLAMRERPARPGVHDRTLRENWHGVLAEFCRCMPRRVAELVENPTNPRFDTGTMIWVLAACPSVEAAPTFQRCLEHESPWFREHALAGLIRLRHSPAIGTLIEYLNDHPDRAEVSVIVRAMFEWPALRQHAALPGLRTIAAGSEADGVRRWADELASAIEHHRSPPPRPGWFGTA